MGERAPAVGAAGADASLAQQRAERAGEARAMLGKKGAPSLFKFGFKVVPRVPRAVWGCGLLELGLAVLLRQPMLEGACIRACTAWGCGLLELELRPSSPTVQEGGRLVVFGDECALCGIVDRCCFEAQCWPNLCTARPSILAPNPLRCHV